MIKQRIINGVIFKYNDNNFNAGASISDGKGNEILLSAKALIEFSGLFWKGWSFEKIKGNVLENHKKDIEEKITKIADKIKYW